MVSPGLGTNTVYHHKQVGWTDTLLLRTSILKPSSSLTECNADHLLSVFQIIKEKQVWGEYDRIRHVVMFLLSISQHCKNIGKVAEQSLLTQHEGHTHNYYVILTTWKVALHFLPSLSLLSKLNLPERAIWLGLQTASLHQSLLKTENRIAW